MRTVIIFLVCSVLFPGLILPAEEPSAQLPPPVISKTTSKSGNENIAAAATNDSNFWKKFNEWEALMEGKNGMPKDEAKAGQILTQLIKGVYLVKFGPANGFNPQAPGDFLEAFYKTSSLKSAKDRLGGGGFFRTKSENNKLIASFLTEQPDKMKQDIEKNHQLVFTSSEKITPDEFILHVKSAQESLRNKPVVKSRSPTVANTVSKNGEKNISFLCAVQSETEVIYEIHLDDALVSSGKAMPNPKNKLTHILATTPGEHNLTVIAQGYETWQKTITLLEGSKNKQSFLVELKKPTEFTE